MMNDNTLVIAVSNIGMYEHENLQENEIVLTLVRTVGYMGD